jgi:hypothetical protein
LRELLLVVREMRAALRYQALTVLVTIDDIPDLLAELSDGDTLLGPVVRSVLADTEAITRLRIEAAEDLEELGDEAVAEVVAATQGLAWRGLDMVPPERDVLVVDSLARAVLDLEEPVRSEDVDSEYWSLLDEPTVNRMTGSEHPETDAVLRAIATGHPAGRIRKAAKKALHKRTTARQ